MVGGGEHAAVESRIVKVSRQPLGALRQHLEGVPMREQHHSQHLIDVLIGHVLVEEIGHAVDENSLRLLPRERLRQVRRPRLHLLEGLGVLQLAHGGQPGVHRLGVAGAAPRTDLAAAYGWVPRRIGPLDAAV
jgi:hypothetical protein